jgi:P pilus assembly chaperone PapD
MKLNSYNFLLGLAFASSVAAPAAQAEIVIHGTRVIYPSDAREVTLQVSNNGSKPALVSIGLMKVIQKVLRINQKFLL